MAATPVLDESFPFRASAFDKFPVKAAIDRGNTLTKIVFVPKDTPPHVDTVQLRCLTFLNDHFDDALRVMKEHAQLPDQGKIHITGTASPSHKQKIRDILGLDIEFVDEFSTITHGAFALINNADPEDVFYPVPDYKKWILEFKLFDSIRCKEPEFNELDGKFPALILHMGSGGGVWVVDKDGKSRNENMIGFSGKCFIGVANALLGVSDYDEIIELAKKGGSYADTVTGDLLRGDTNSAYGTIPPDLPVFPFGKASEKTWDPSGCTKEDLAASLLFTLVSCCDKALFAALDKTGIRKVYITGNFFRNEYVRKKVYEYLCIFTGGIQVEALVVKCGQQGAIGAMLMDGVH